MVSKSEISSGLTHLAFTTVISFNSLTLSAILSILGPTAKIVVFLPFFTTSSLRDYHYTKQKNNAYYHIQAINLPFQNIEFYYIGGK